MVERQSLILQNLRTKIENVVRQLQHEKQRVEQLEQKNLDLELQLKEKEKEIVHLKSQKLTLEDAQVFQVDESQRRRTRDHLTKMMREIDLCIQIIHQSDI